MEKYLNKFQPPNRKWLKRAAAGISALAMLVSVVPYDSMQCFAEEAKEIAEDIKVANLDFPQELIDTINEFGNGEYDGREVLETLYRNGTIDENCNFIFNGVYNVDGVDVTEDELRYLATGHYRDEEVVLNGMPTDWGEVSNLLVFRDFLAAAKEYQDGVASGEIPEDDAQRQELEEELFQELESRLTIDNNQIYIAADDNGGDDGSEDPWFTHSDSYRGENADNKFKISGSTLVKESDDSYPVTVSIKSKSDSYDEYNNTYTAFDLQADLSADIDSDESLYCEYKLDKLDAFAEKEQDITVELKTGNFLLDKSGYSFDLPIDEADRDENRIVRYRLTVCCDKAVFTQNGDKSNYYSTYFSVGDSNGANYSQEAVKFDNFSSNGNAVVDWSDYLDQAIESIKVDPARTGKNGMVPVVIQMRGGYSLNTVTDLDPTSVFMGLKYKTVSADGTEKYYYATPADSWTRYDYSREQIPVSSKGVSDSSIDNRINGLNEGFLYEWNPTVTEQTNWETNVVYRNERIVYKHLRNNTNFFETDKNGCEAITFFIPASEKTYLVGLDVVQHNGEIKEETTENKINDQSYVTTYKESMPHINDRKYTLEGKFSDELVGLDITLFKDIEPKVYIGRNIVGDSSYTVKQSEIFDTAHIQRIPIDKDMNGNPGNDRWFEVRIPFAKKDAEEIAKQTAEDNEFVAKGGLEGGSELTMPARNGSEFSEEALQWVLENSTESLDKDGNVIGEPYLKSAYVDDGYLCEDPKVYVHYKEAEGSNDAKDCADYIYFQVKIPYLPVPMSSKAYVHLDLFNQGASDAWKGETYLPETNLGVEYSFSEYTPVTASASGVYTVNSDLGSVWFLSNPEFDSEYDRIMKGESTDLNIKGTQKNFPYLANRMYGRLLDNNSDDPLYIYDSPYYNDEKKENYLLPVNETYRIQSLAPMFSYSDYWQTAIDGGGDTNGFSRTFWKNSFVKNCRNEGGEPNYITDSSVNNQFFSTFTYSDSSYVERPVFKGMVADQQAEQDVQLTLSASDFKKMQTEENPYPLQISVSDSEFVGASVTNSYSIAEIKKYFGENANISADSDTVSVASTTAKDQNGFTNDVNYHWTIEFTSSSGEKYEIEPNDRSAAVYYEAGKSGSEHYARILDFNDNDEGTFRFVLRLSNSVDAVNKSFGMAGSDDVTLTDDDYIKLVSSPIALIESKDPYLIVPSASKKITAIEASSTPVLFNSNVSRKNKVLFNAESTNYSIDVYECDEEGIITNDIPVYSHQETAPYDKSFTNFEIPNGILKNVSSDAMEPVYKAVLKTSLAEEYEGMNEFTDTALISVKEKPISFEVNVDSPFYINNDDINVPYKVINAESGFSGYYKVVRMSDNKEVMKEDIPSSASGGSLCTLTIPQDKLAISSKNIKEKFSVNFYGRNDEADEYSVGSTLLSVYNDGSLRIAVNGRIAENGSTNVISRRSYIENELLNDDKVTLNMSKGIAKVQRDLSISASAFVNGGSSLGGISDAINWSYESKDQDNPISLYYILYGTANKLAEAGKSFLPSIEMMISGELDAEGLVRAVHEKTGMTAETNIKIDDVENELYILQCFPLTKTTIEYTNAEGVKRVLETNDMGQIAIYEPGGYPEDGILRAHSVYKNGFYKNEFYISEFKSGSRDQYQNSFYPINKLQLHCGYAASITIPEAKDKTVHVRGGAYKYGGVDMYNHLDTYCEAADIYDTYDTIDDHNGKSNGIDGIDIKADDSGTFEVYFDSNQLLAEGESEFNLELGMAFEVSVDGYHPVTIEIPAGSCNSEFSAMNYATQNVDKIESSKYLDTYHENIYYPSSGNEKKIDSKNVGYTSTSPLVELRVKSAIIGYDNAIVKDDNKHSHLSDEELNVYYINRETKDILDNGVASDPIQSSESYVYQFSTIVNNYLTLKCSEKHLTPIIPKDYFIQVNLGAYENDVCTVEKGLDYSIINEPDAVNPTDPKEIKKMRKKLQEELEDMPSLLSAGNGESLSGKIIGGITETIGTTMMHTAEGPQAVGKPFTCTFLPTADPTKFEILIGTGAEDDIVSPDMRDGNVSASLGVQFAEYAEAKISTDDEDDDDEYDFGGYLQEGLEFSGSDFFNEEKRKDTVEKFNSHKKEDKNENNNKKENKKTDGNKNGENNGENNEDDNEAEIKVYSTIYGIVSAEYNPDAKNDDEKWTFSFKGLSAGVGVEVEKNLWEGNTFVGPVPITYSVKLKAEGHFKVSHKINSFISSVPVEDGIGKFKPEKPQRHLTLIDFLVGGGIEAYCGVGANYELIELSAGVFANAGIDINVLSLIDSDFDDFQMGIKGGIEVEVGIMVKAKLLVASYEQTICSVQGSFEAASDRYNNIANKWSGYTGTSSLPGFYNSKTDQLQSLGADQVDDDQVLLQFNTVSMTVPSMKAAIKEDETIFTDSEKADKITEVSVSEDGKMIVYLDDNIASYADGNGVSAGAVITESDGNLAPGEGIPDEDEEDLPELSDDEKKKIDNDPEQGAPGESIRNYGDYYISVSGTDGNYFTAWTQQRNDISKSLNRNAEINLADVAMALNSTEIIVAAYKGGKWVPEKLTNNYQSDISPKMASVGDKAVVVWETSIGSDVENILQSDVTDMLMYSVYDGSNWSEPQVLYNGTFGTICTFEAAMAKDGTTAVTYTLSDGNDSGDVFYTLIDADGTAGAPVRATVASSNETDVKVTAVDDAFVIAWYDVDEADIMLLYVNTDGTIDSTFPESVAGSSKVGISNVFDICGGESIDDFTVIWSYSDKVQDEENNTESRRSVFGSKICKTDDMTKTTPAQLIDRVEKNAAADSISIAANGEDGVKIVIAETVYGDPESTDVAPEVVAAMLLEGEEFNSDEEYQKALAAKTEELKKSDSKGLYTFLSAEKTTRISNKDYNFINEIYIEDATYDEDTVIPGFETAVDITVLNMGIDPINSFTVNETDEVPLTTPLMPGESTQYTYKYKIGEQVEDLVISVEADNGAASTAELYVDVPRPVIESAEIAKAEDGIRTVNMRIVNGLSAPFETSGKDLYIDLYADNDYQNLFDSIKIDNADVLANIDSGVGNVEIRIDAEEYKSFCGVYDDEIPEGGLPVYIIAAVKDTDGTVLEYAAAGVTIESRMTDRKNPLSIVSTLTKDTDSVVVDSVVHNDSLTDQYLCNINVQLFDGEGNLIAEKNTYDESITDFDTLTKESSLSDDKYQVTFDDLTAEEIEKAAYAVSSAFNNTLNITYSYGENSGLENTGTTIVLGNKIIEASAPQPVSEIGEFGGWYADEECTEEFDFTKAVIKDTTLYAKWKLPNIDVTADGVFTAPDGTALVYDAETRTLTTADGTNPCYGNGTVSVNADALAANAESGKIEGAENFSVAWFDSEGNAIDAADVRKVGDYTVKISGTEAGEALGVDGTLVIHVTVDPYVLTLDPTDYDIYSENREYDGKTDMTAFAGNNRVNSSQLFNDDSEVYINITSATADSDFGNVKVTCEIELSGDDAANYVAAPVVTDAEITQRSVQITWNYSKSDSEKQLTYNFDGTPELKATVENLVKGDDVTVEVDGDKAEMIGVEQLAQATGLSGEDAEKYKILSTYTNPDFIWWRAAVDTVVLETASLTLDGNIGVNIYAHIPDELMQDENAYVTVSTGNSKDIVMVKDLELANSVLVDGDYVISSDRHRLSHYFAAKEMHDDIEISFHTGSGKLLPVVNSVGESITNSKFRYSVADYIKTVENAESGTYSDKLVELVGALKDYGSAVQTYFDYNTDSKFEMSDKPSGVTAKDVAGYSYIEEGTMPEGITLRSASLVLESETSIRVYLNIDETASLDDAVFTVNGEEASLLEKNGLYYIEMPDISARNLDADYTFTIGSKTTGETYTLNFSALSYADMVLSMYSRNSEYEDLCNVARTLYLYSQAAENYFSAN